MSSRGMVEKETRHLETSRRRYPRVVSVGRCFVRLGEGWEGSVVDLSLCGMLVRLRRPLNPGSAYFVKLVFGNRVAVVEARVVRVVERDEDCLAGMEFLVLSPEDAESLQSHFSGLARGRG